MVSGSNEGLAGLDCWSGSVVGMHEGGRGGGRGRFKLGVEVWCSASWDGMGWGSGGTGGMDS